MTSYTVTRRDGLLIVYGALPVNEALAMTQSMLRNSVFCTLLPKQLEATFVIGPPDAINAERERNGIAEGVTR